MISTPRRAVTRFFIPLIDVLILLFCIFLLMPFVSGPTAPEPSDPKPPKEKLPDNVEALQRELKEAKERITRMEAAMQAGLADRVIVRALQVGKDANGVFLYYYDDTGRREIRNSTQTLQLIAQQKTLAIKTGGVKDVMFLILYPHDAKGNPLGYPNAKAEKEIQGWFGDLPVKFQ